MKKLTLITALLLSNPVYAATAYFTGVQKQVQTVTYQIGWKCQYRYAGQTFWKVFLNSCPSSVEVY